jgi:hypothetical protein
MLLLDRVERPAQLVVDLAGDASAMHQVSPETAKT